MAAASRIAPATLRRVKLIEVNRAACEAVAALLRRQPIPEDKEDSALPDFERARIGNFFLALVAICHQTSPRGRPPLEGWSGGRRLKGWDYLFARFEEAARNDPSLLTATVWATIRAEIVRDLFLDHRFGERLTDPEGRAALLRDLGSGMRGRGWTNADDMYAACNGRLMIGEPNLLGLLREFRAYSDPVRKKSLFFLALMRNSGVWTYPDPENLGPLVDYHEVRGHLRLGTVRVLDDPLRRRLITGEPVTLNEDVEIRQAVYDAIVQLSELTGLHNPSQLHYLFWSVFRSVCLREEPQCLELDSRSTLPQRYRPLCSIAGEPARCPFSGICPSARLSARYLEHVVETDYY